MVAGLVKDGKIGTGGGDGELIDLGGGNYQRGGEGTGVINRTFSPYPIKLHSARVPDHPPSFGLSPVRSGPPRVPEPNTTRAGLREVLVCAHPYPHQHEI